jgi:hypothetical protein
MQTSKNSSHPLHVRPVISQAQNNTTLWVGHLKTDPTDHFAGQTFKCPDEGQLDNIQIYSSAVQYGGEVVLTLHEFDPASKKWGSAIGSSTVEVRSGDDDKWIRFALPQVQLRKDASYGFRVQTRNALVALGEAASGNKHPFTFGHEWNGDSLNQTGHYYSYFSLAFKVELCA